MHDKSLVGRIFKAIYYPTGSVLEAQLGSNPSFIWRNMFESRNMVKKGKQMKNGDWGSNNYS